MEIQYTEQTREKEVNGLNVTHYRTEIWLDRRVMAKLKARAKGMHKSLPRLLGQIAAEAALDE